MPIKAEWVIQRSDEDKVLWKEMGTVIIWRGQALPQGATSIQLCGWA